MPPIKATHPESSTHYYLQQLIKRQRAYRKRKAKRTRRHGFDKPGRPFLDDPNQYEGPTNP
jgi:hypothetical protein